MNVSFHLDETLGRDVHIRFSIDQSDVDAAEPLTLIFNNKQIKTVPVVDKTTEIKISHLKVKSAAIKVSFLMKAVEKTSLAWQLHCC